MRKSCRDWFRAKNSGTGGVAALAWALLFVLFSFRTASAGDATWLLTPQNSDWNIAGNWTGGGPPNGPADVATFSTSNVTTVSISASTQVSAVMFAVDANAFTITASPAVTLTIRDVGLTNSSSNTQSFIAATDTAGAGHFVFRNSAAAGNKTAFYNHPAPTPGTQPGVTTFQGTSTAGNATFTNAGGVNRVRLGGLTEFLDNSTAGTATFNNLQAVPGVSPTASPFPVVRGPGVTQFRGNSSADHAVFFNQADPADFQVGGSTEFYDNSTAANATFTNFGGADTDFDSGTTLFTDNSIAGNATIINKADLPGTGRGGIALFLGNSSGGHAVITNHGAQFAFGLEGGFTFVGGIQSENPTLGNATITNEASTVANGAAGATEVDGPGGSAGNATIVNKGAAVSGARAGRTAIVEQGSAGSAHITAEGSTVSGGDPGFINVRDNGTAANSTLVAEGGTISGALGGRIQFSVGGAAAQAILIANPGSGGGAGGSITFRNNSTGDNAQVKVFGNGFLNLSGHNPPDFTLGSIEGDGIVHLGGLALNVGGNNLSTTFSGSLQEGGPSGGTGASLTKFGTGRLTFAGTQSYTGPTTINGGGLVVNTVLNSNVTVGSGGTLGGNGTVNGLVMCQGTIAPGSSTGELKIGGDLQLTSSATLAVEIGGTTPGTKYDVLNKTDNLALTLNGKLAVSFVDGFVPASSDSFTVVLTQAQLKGAFTNVASGARVDTVGGTGSCLVTYNGNNVVISDCVLTTPPAKAQLLNIATRMRVQTGENVLIGGFIITGSDPKKVIIRGIGPSLSSFFSGVLKNPTLELFQGNTSLQSNDDWKTDQRTEIEATGIPPTNNLEPAIVRTIAPGAYTAILRGSGNSSGIGVVEAYDLDQAANSKLANIATRGFVETGNNVMIGGLIVGPAGASNAKVVVRAIGPSLGNFGIAGAVQDPMLDFVNSNGVTLRSNDDWKVGGQQTELTAIGLQPSDDRESAVVQTVAPGNYTAIVRGKDNTTGVGLVEVYNVE